MNILMQTVPRETMRPGVDGADWYFEQRYLCQTCGVKDTQITDRPQDCVCPMCKKLMHRDEWLIVKVNPLSDWRYEVLLKIHEAVEAIMCRHKGVKVAEVDAFDLEYESTHSSDLNAGDDPRAPYVRQHCIATGIERVLSAELDVNWEIYDKDLETRYPGPSHK